MKRYPKFLEYLNSKGKLQEKPTVDPMADQLDPADDKAPPKAVTSGKGWKIEAPSSKEAPKPYKAPGVPVKPKAAESGFADKGSIPAWNPKMDQGSSKNIPGGKEIEGWKKGKTEAFIKKTKDMDIKEFTEYMIETCGCGVEPQQLGDEDSIPMVTSYAAGKFHPHPPEAIKYVVVLANKNDRVLESLIQELKRGGGMKKLVKALMDDHPETYDNFTDLLDDDEAGDQRANAMAKSMSEKLKTFTDMMGESVVPPFGFEDEDGEDSDESEDEEMEAPEDGEGPEDGTEEGEEGEEDEGDGPPAMKMEPPEEESPPMPPPSGKRRKKTHGIARLLKALDRYENMASYMRSCMNPM